MIQSLAQNTVLNTTLPGTSIEELLLLVADDDHGFKAEATEKLLSMGITSIYSVLERGVRNDANADFRNGAMEILVAFGREAVAPLVRLLRDQNEEVRNFASVMLGDIGHREAVGPLIKALSDKDVNVSHSAAEALGKIGDRSALFPLMELLKGDFWVQYSAVTAIGAMRDYRAVPQLLQMLDNELLAGAVIDALGQIGDPRALYPLGKMLPKLDTALAGQAAKALMTIYRSVSESLSFKNSLAEYMQPEHLKNVINDEGIEKLRTLLDTAAEPGVREASILLLGWLGDDSAINAFCRVLEDESLMGAVETAIFAIGKSASGSLRAALEDENDNVRIVALRTLRDLGTEENPELYVGHLFSTNENLLLEAIESVKNIPAEIFLPLLSDLLKTGSAAVSVRAAEALGRYPFPALKKLLTSLAVADKAELRKRGALLLGYTEEGDDSRLIEHFMHDSDPEVRKAAVNAAGMQRSSMVVPMLAGALNDPDVRVRVAAAMAIGEFRTPLLVEDLLANLGKVAESLDYAIIKAIGMMGASPAQNRLLEFLENGISSRRLEYALLDTLGKISAVAASELIRCRYLASIDPDIRRLAVETLGQLGDKNSIEAVESALSDSHWSVRVAALHVLGKLGGIKEIPLLVQAVDDPDPMVRKHAILALGNLRDISALPVLIQQLTDMEMSKHAFVAVLKFGRPVLPWLHRHMLKNYSVDVRIRLIDLIGKIGDRKSVEPLMELLDDPNPMIRLAAIDSLTFCFDGVLLKRLTDIKRKDTDAEVQKRADLALKTFTMEKYN